MEFKLYTCRKGHVIDHPVGIVLDDYQGGRAGGIGKFCRACLMAWLDEEFGAQPCTDPAVMAAFKLGGLEAARAAAKGEHEESIAERAEQVLDAMGIPTARRQQLRPVVLESLRQKP